MKRQTIEFKLHNEVELPQDFIDHIPSSGPADSYVKDLLRNYNVECLEQDLVKFLKSYGAWDSDELQDHDINIERLVWLSCLNCQENDTTYFYMGE